jgi:hypothetical protein
VRVWDARTLDCVAILDTRPTPAWCVTFCEGGRAIVAGVGVHEASGAIVVWRAPGLPPAEGAASPPATARR